MKKLLVFLLLVLSVFLSFNNVNNVYAEDNLSLKADAALLIEPNSKTILYEKNKDKRLYPASMTKMMGLSLVLEEIVNNNVSWDDKVICSSYASSMGGTQIYLSEGEEMSLRDLFKAVAINSANDAVVALLEHLYGSKEVFLKKMNDKAKELNMNDTHFNNATGFDDEEHYTTAYDMALLGSYLVSFGNLILQYTSLKEAYIRENTDSPFWLVNTNKLLKYYSGMDGLKTGYTSKAGYNLTSTAKRNGVRLLCVVMNEKTIQDRSLDTINLLNYGFSLLKCENIFLKDSIINEIAFNTNSSIKTLIKVNEDVNIYLFKDEDKDNVKIELIINDYNLPIKENDVVGYLKITTSRGLIYKYNVYSTEDVEKNKYINILWDNIKLFFA